MFGVERRSQLEKVRLIVLPAILCAVLGYLLSNSAVVRRAGAFSAGPPAGYTGAPGEEPEACAECHVPADAGTGRITITAPQTYVPGQTYPITVTHSNSDLTRLRWGFELTVLDSGDEKAGNLQSLNAFTQILNNQGPGSARQYIEHTASGTFIGQQNGASWTFNWTAPSTDVGPVTFYTAGNQANNDGNTSGDYIYKTFVTSVPQSTTADFAISVSPQSRIVVPGGSVDYQVTITPFAGFTGIVNLSASSLPPGVTAQFIPASVNITDANSVTATLMLATTGSTSVAKHQIDVNGQSGLLMHTSQVSLNVVSSTSADLSVAKSASPNPAQVGVQLAYRISVVNNGPATATGVTVSDALPGGLTFVSATPTQGSCNGTNIVNCNLGSLTNGASAFVTIVVTPTAQGQVVNTATGSATEFDFDSTNNSSTITTFVEPPVASPSMTDPNLMVSTVVSGLNQPTSMAFLGANDFFVLERTTGKVQRIVNGAYASTPLDLVVNNASERGLLGIALHPRFTENHFVYLFWTESSTGFDTSNINEIPLLGNRVDRYLWNGSTLAFDRNLIKLRALQQDAGQPARGNHNGGVLRFGLDQKLYIIFGDNGRRGFLQNIVSGGQVPDDQFGGPEPDNAHLTGVILRLNDDGSTPSDNPFFNAATSLTPEAATNVKKVFAYGVRNSFGMAVDPLSGNLWTQENGDDAFDEINRVIPGFNGGWIQTMGPLSRINEFRSIEMTYAAGNLQQLRWPPSNTATTPQQALSRLFMLPGAQYVDPEFSWKYAVAPSPIGFVTGRGLGPKYEGDLLVGASRTTLLNGYLFRFKLNSDRLHFSFTDSALADRVADNQDKFDLLESTSLVAGRDFGVTTDIQTGPNGNVFVVSLSNGAVYEIKAKPSTVFVANLNGGQEVPPTNSTATGMATLVLSNDEKSARLSLSFSGLSSAQTDAHIHGPAPAGVTAPVLFPLPLGQVNDFEIALTPSQAADLKNGLWYVNVHSSTFPSGEIRGQFQTSSTTSSVQVNASSIIVNESERRVMVPVSRFGNTSNSASVNFSTSDTAPANCSTTNGNASDHCDYQTTIGTLQFGPGETIKTVSIAITDDAYVEGNENFKFTLTQATGAVLGPPTQVTVTITDNDTSVGANPIDDAAFFVAQHYRDFLNREPDIPGLNHWTGEITECSDPAKRFPGESFELCTERKRANTSAAFFLSPEFQNTGSFVLRVYWGTLGKLLNTPCPGVPNGLPGHCRPRYSEYITDMAQVSQGIVVNDHLDPARINANKQAFVAAFVQRPEFLAIYGSLTNTQYVDKLFQTTGITPSSSDRQALIDELNANAPNARASVAFKVVDGTTTITDGQLQFNTSYGQAFYNQEFDPAFVMMEYLGYLRRNPDQEGYDFWLAKLRRYGNWVDSQLVLAFILSPEYRSRFGPP